jgi:hypothetical protein
MILRRSFLLGLVSALAAPAIVRAESIMPVRALILPPAEPLVRGIRWQSWPLGQKRPDFFAEGSMGVFNLTPEPAARRPASEYLEEIKRFRPMYPDIAWQIIA